MIRKIMFYSHELGREISFTETLKKCKKLHKYLNSDDDDDDEISYEHALSHMLEGFERRYKDKYGN